MDSNPSIDPDLLIRMLIVGYCFGILRSGGSVGGASELGDGFCQLGLEGDLPDHSTFSKVGHSRFRNADLLRELLEAVVWCGLADGLVSGEGFVTTR